MELTSSDLLCGRRITEIWIEEHIYEEVASILVLQLRLDSRICDTSRCADATSKSRPMFRTMLKWYTPKLRHWSSNAEMTEHFRVSGAERLVVLPVDFLYEWVTCDCGIFSLALPLTRPGQVPQIAQFPRSVVVVGLNEGLAGVDLARRAATFTCHVGSPFYEFVRVDERGVVALFETAVVSVTSRGDENWTVDTELIVDSTVVDDQICLSFDDGTRAVLDLVSGSLVD